jgi:hypothetical protein
MISNMKIFLISLGFGVIAIFMLFICVCVILPQFERTSVQLPASCDGSYAGTQPPDSLAYALPDGKGTGILVARGDGIAVVAMVTSVTPHASDIFVVNTSSNGIQRMLHFADVSIMAGTADGVMYLYNDKLGYFLDAHTGAPEGNLITIDNYGGLSESDRSILVGTSSGVWYVETSVIVSSLSADGAVRLRSHAIMNAIARGCFVSGTTGAVKKL